MPRARLITAFLLSAAALPFAASSPASAQVEGKTNQQWFPDLLDLSPLRQESPKSNPMGSDYDYRRQVETLDVAALKQDIATVLNRDRCFNRLRRCVILLSVEVEIPGAF